MQAVNKDLIGMIIIIHVNNGTCTGGKTKVICQGQKFKKIMSSSEKVFYGGNNLVAQHVRGLNVRLNY